MGTKNGANLWITRCYFALYQNHTKSRFHNLKRDINLEDNLSDLKSL